MLKFEFGDSGRRRLEDAVSGQNLRSLLHLLHRNAVEDVRDDNSNGSSENGNKLRDCSEKERKKAKEDSGDEKEGITERKGEKSEGKENIGDKCICEKSCLISDKDKEKSDIKVANIKNEPNDF